MDSSSLSFLIHPQSSNRNSKPTSLSRLPFKLLRPPEFHFPRNFMATGVEVDDFIRMSRSRQSRGSSASVDEEEEVLWAAIERLPTYDRLRKGMLRQVAENGKVVYDEVDVRKLGFEERKGLMEKMVKVVEEDNEKFLRRIRDRMDRMGIEIPKIEVRFEKLSVEGDVYVGSRAQPTLLNVTLNTFEVFSIF
ncbi:unnamed protein product [Citrullus colocynthis]|uniref:Pleiotropic ABC efflux transporter N-terminal domain-containing protein n=1 Tax=Citrullus colocynthis TaxID=252529 RepID=A0ABP0YRB3_9ROSI